MIWDILLGQMPYLLEGLLIAVELLFFILLIGFVFGLALALLEVYGPTLARWFCFVFERIFRGTPEIVLLLLFFYGVGDFYELSPFAAAAIALGLRSTAYQSQIFRGAIQAVAQGQMAAARAMGMTRAMAIRYIVLPQALRQSIGPWTNEFSSGLKATSLAYVIGVVELTRQGRYIISSTHGNILIVFAVVAAMYFIVNWLGNRLLYALERRVSVPGFEGQGTS